MIYSHPIPDPRFSVVLFPFTSDSHWLFLFPSRSHSGTGLHLCHQMTLTVKLNNARNGSLIKEKNEAHPQKYTRSVKASSISWTYRFKPNVTVYDKLCKNKSTLTVYYGGEWKNVAFSFPPISIKLFPFPFP